MSQHKIDFIDSEWFIFDTVDLYVSIVRISLDNRV